MTEPSANRGSLRFDLVAGLTAAAVVLPKAMAYATVAGLPVAVGLYTAFLPMVIYALLGSSRVLSVSSTTTVAILAGTQLGLAVPDGDPGRLLVAVATLSALVGVALILAAALRLGFVANFISAPVLTGFKAGIGLVIVLDQVPKLLGIHIAKAGFFRDVGTLVQHVPETSLITAAVAGATLLVLIGIERFRPKLPAPLVAIGGGIAAAWYFGLDDLGVSTVGLIPQGLPTLTLPDLALARQMIPGALGIALMSFTETIAAGRAFADRSDPPIDANRELIATGAANLGGAFTGAMPAGGGTSQTAVVRAADGRSQKASLVTAADRGADHAAARAPDRPDAPCDTGRGRDRVLGRTDRARGVRGDPQGAHDGVPLGAGGLPRRAGVRHAEGHRRRDHRVADRSRQSDRPPAGVRDRPQTRCRRAAPALSGASGRRDLRGTADRAARGPHLLSERAECRGAAQCAGRAVPAARVRARPEPGARHRVLRPAAADRGGAACLRRAASTSGWSD